MAHCRIIVKDDYQPFQIHWFAGQVRHFTGRKIGPDNKPRGPENCVDSGQKSLTISATRTSWERLLD
jgi:hypothetical protein